MCLLCCSYLKHVLMVGSNAKGTVIVVFPFVSGYFGSTGVPAVHRIQTQKVVLCGIWA